MKAVPEQVPDQTSDGEGFFRPVGEFCTRGLVTCEPDAPLLDMVRVMRDRNISSIVVCDGGAPAGIFTDRDLRNRVVADDRSAGRLKVRDIMASPLSTIGEHEYLYEALHRMSREGIHRLVVIGDDGNPAGIITNTDLLKQQAHSPHQLVLDIETAQSVAELAGRHQRMQALTVHLSKSGMRAREIVRLIAHLNDQVLVRLVHLLRSEYRYARLTDQFGFVVLGSEGRREQTLSTDQDNAIVYADELDEAGRRLLEAFSVELIDALIEIGVPRCPGGIMAKNPEWRRSLSEWGRQLDHWLGSPSPENVMQGGMFLDIRTVHGDAAFERTLKDRITAFCRDHALFPRFMARNSLRFQPPLGWFGRIKTERRGPHAGALDVKKAGIFAITDGIKALSLEAGCLDGSTYDRIDRLARAEILRPDQARNLEASFGFLISMRLRGQVAAVEAGENPTNFIALDQLNRMEHGRFRIALKEVRDFQTFIKRRFRLEQM